MDEGNNRTCKNNHMSFQIIATLPAWTLKTQHFSRRGKSIGKSKGKVRPKTRHEGPPRGGEKYTSTLSLTSALDVVGR